MVAHAQEFPGIGALEAVDRLLGVADGEDGPRRASRAPSPAKNSSASACTTSHCSGLVSCASSIRMWSSPPSSLNSTQGAHARTLQQIARLQHEIVVIEQRARPLCALIGGEQRVAEPHQRDGGGMQRGGAARRDRPA